MWGRYRWWCCLWWWWWGRRRERQGRWEWYRECWYGWGHSAIGGRSVEGGKGNGDVEGWMVMQVGKKLSPCPLVSHHDTPTTNTDNITPDHQPPCSPIFASVHSPITYSAPTTPPTTSMPPLSLLAKEETSERCMRVELSQFWLQVPFPSPVHRNCRWTYHHFVC